MKNITLAALVFLVVSAPTLAKPKRFYADVQVTNIEPTADFLWQRKNKNTPKYPIELARSGIRGCAILSFDISASGKTENIEVISSVPQKHLGKYSRKMLRKWRWTPTDRATTEPVTEKRTLRLDFCMGRESSEQSQLACRQQAQMACR